MENPRPIDQTRNMHINVFLIKYQWNNYVINDQFDLLNENFSQIDFFEASNYLYSKHLDIIDQFDLTG